MFKYFKVILLIAASLIVIVGCQDPAIPIEADTSSTPITQEAQNLAERHYKVGLTAIDAKNYKVVLEELGLTVKLNPKHAKAYSKIGRVYIHKNNPIKAEKYINKAIELNPNLPDTYNNLAGIYSDKKDNEKAIELYKN